MKKMSTKSKTFKSNKTEKNKNSAKNNRDPGNPKKVINAIRIRKYKFGLAVTIPEISVINLVLYRLVTESISKKKFDEISAWLIIIAKPAIQKIE